MVTFGGEILMSIHRIKRIIESKWRIHVIFRQILHLKHIIIEQNMTFEVMFIFTQFLTA